jgi:hypothetical protein
MNAFIAHKSHVTEKDKGPFGDARPGNSKDDPRANPSLPQADVDDRENVSTVMPEDYPAADRAIAAPVPERNYMTADANIVVTPKHKAYPTAD